jgi:hypothetical protein
MASASWPGNGSGKQRAISSWAGKRLAAPTDGRAQHYSVRQLSDTKDSVEVEALLPNGIATYARLCGWTLARAHARSGDRVATAAYLGQGDVFDRAVADFAAAYADQNERDHQSLLAAVEEGRLEAQRGL